MVYSDGGTWYPEACRALGLSNTKTLIFVELPAARGVASHRRDAGLRARDTLPAPGRGAVTLRLSGPPVFAVKQATSVIPIVFATVADPLGDGLVASLARRFPAISLDASNAAAVKSASSSRARAWAARS